MMGARTVVESDSKNLMLTVREDLIGKTASNTCVADILCVIDVSGSMSGEKLDNVKTTLKYLTHIMEDNRLAIVLFDSAAELYLNFKLVNEKTKDKIIDCIDRLQPKGGTNIQKAVQKTQEALAQRKTKNSFCSVIFLSDGQHNEGPLDE